VLTTLFGGVQLKFQRSYLPLQASAVPLGYICKKKNSANDAFWRRSAKVPKIFSL